MSRNIDPSREYEAYCGCRRKYDHTFDPDRLYVLSLCAAELLISKEPRQMRHTNARWTVIASALILLEVNDVSNHAVGFESSEIGATPAGWTSTLTGSGNPKWTVESDETAPSKSKVLKQSGRA